MKNLMFIVTCVALSCEGLAQNTSLTASDLQRFFRLTSEVVEYRGKKAEFKGQKRVDVYPEINQKPTNSSASFINHYQRRFSYILVNRTEYLDFAKFHPDTVRMSKLYAQHLVDNKPFMNYLLAFLTPLTKTKQSESQHYSKQEMMMVGSRFFLCDYVSPDTTVSGHICIGLNGTKEANWGRDYTLLEAFCFEAIFNKLDGNENENAVLMSKFSQYKSKNTVRFKSFSKNNDQLLKEVKEGVFKDMEVDDELSKVLLDYYSQNVNNLPFKID